MAPQRAGYASITFALAACFLVFTISVGSVRVTVDSQSEPIDPKRPRATNFIRANDAALADMNVSASSTRAAKMGGGSKVEFNGVIEKAWDQIWSTVLTEKKLAFDIVLKTLTSNIPVDPVSHQKSASLATDWCRVAKPQGSQLRLAAEAYLVQPLNAQAKRLQKDKLEGLQLQYKARWVDLMNLPFEEGQSASKMLQTVYKLIYMQSFEKELSFADVKTVLHAVPHWHPNEGLMDLEKKWLEHHTLSEPFQRKLIDYCHRLHAFCTSPQSTNLAGACCYSMEGNKNVAWLDAFRIYLWRTVVNPPQTRMTQAEKDALLKS